MSGSGPSDLRSFFGKGASVSSKTLSGNKPASPKTPKGSGSKKSATQDSDTHKDGGPKVVVETNQAGPSFKKATSKHFANGKSASKPPVVKDDDDDDDFEMVDAPRSGSAKKTKPVVANSAKTAIVLDESDDDEVVAVKPKPKPRASGSGAGGGSASKRKKKAIESSSEEDASEEEEVKPVKNTPASNSKGKGKARASTSKRTKADDDFIDDDDDDDPKPKKKAAPRKPNTKPSASKKPKVDEDLNGDDGGAKKEDKPKPKWIPNQERAGPIAPGSKVIPEGAPNCLAGLTFVFTGELESLGREEAMGLAKRYGARTTTGPSSKTSYVVIGSDAGPKKLETIKKHNLKTLDEDGFLALIGSRGEGEVDEKVLKKQKEEEKKVIEVAKTMGPAVQTQGDQQKLKDMLWTVKYAPQAVKDICGNKGQVQKLQEWLHNWQKNRESGFKKPGKDGTGVSRAMMIYGPPGIGKTTAAHLVAKLEGFDVIELNASDTRSKKLLQAEVSNTTGQHGIAGFYKPGDGDNVNKNNLVIIMDEVDGMSAGDRGGVGALSALIKKTQVPMILIANDMSLPKMKPLKFGLHQLQFRRPSAAEIRSRMLSVAFKEKLKIPGNVIDELVAGSQADIRQVINMMSTYKLGADDMNFDQGKAMARLNEKNSVTTPWTLMNKLFAPITWAPNSGLSLAEKEGIYFVDHDMLPMFVQDGYLRYNPSSARNDHSPMGDLAKLRLVSKAADAISDGDLISGMIRGAQQWSLMPLHAQMSCVTPASHMHGLSSAGFGMGFPAWFGKNSTQGRLARLLGEVQIRMRLKVSGDRREIRQAYLPALFPRLFDPLVDQGVDGVEGVIDLMDDYYLGREEWDTVVELLSMGDDVDDVMKKVPTQVKTAFTRTFNKRNHPIPYHKADASAAKPQKKVAGEAAPDLEDVIEVDESSEGEAAADDDDSDVAKVLAKDKLIKNKAKPAPKPKGGKAGAAAGKPKAKGKAKKEEDSDDD